MLVAMRTCVLSLSLLAISCLLGCSDDGTGTSATTNLTSNPTTETTGDGDGDGPETGDGDGDGPETGDGDGDGYCAHQCASDADCLIDGMSIDLTCVDSVCTSDSPGCTGDEECVALYSGWSTPCTSGGGECDALAQLCIDYGGQGLCATPPSDIIDCATLLMEEIEIPDIDGNLVIVCARSNAVCSEDAFCFLPCGSDADCVSDAYPSCDVESGFCQCSSDADCATLGEPHMSVCNAGACGCGDDQQCIDGGAGDVCTTDGYCGCSGDTACAGVENPFDGGMYACVTP
jgi:hypothetical protein